MKRATKQNMIITFFCPTTFISNKPPNYQVKRKIQQNISIVTEGYLQGEISARK